MGATSAQLLIAVCTRNRPLFLGTCLASVEEQEALPDWPTSIVVVDNSESEDTRRINQSIVGKFGVRRPLTYVHESELGISAARNRALSIADQDDYAAIIFLDDDQALPSSWLRALIGSWQEAATDVMKSSVVLEKVEDVTDLHTKDVSSISQTRLGDSIEKGLKTVATNGVLISRRVFGEMQLTFDPSYSLTGGGDTEYFLRARARGATLGHTHRAVAVEWLPTSRLGLMATLRTGVVRGTTKVRCRHLEGVSAIRCFASGSWFLLSGLVALPVGTLSRSVRDKAVKRLGKGMGLLATLLGVRYLYYRKVAESPANSAAAAGP